MIKLGSVIKEIRRSKGISARHVADKLEVDPSTISKYESNNRKVPAETLPLLADALGVKVEDFFTQRVGETPTNVSA